MGGGGAVLVFDSVRTLLRCSHVFVALQAGSCRHDVQLFRNGRFQLGVSAQIREGGIPELNHYVQNTREGGRGDEYTANNKHMC